MKRVVVLNIIMFLLWGNLYSQGPYPVTVTTTAFSPVTPYLQDAFATFPNGITVRLNSSRDLYRFRVMGKLERLSPSPFVIMYHYLLDNTNANLPQYSMYSTQTIDMPNDEMNDAFANFKNINELEITGINLNDILEGGRIKLPPGQYKICFFAVKDQAPSTMDSIYDSNPNMSCTIFNICKEIAPPQFSQPVSSNLSINTGIIQVQPTQVVNFAWTPPVVGCGSPGPIQYELEIWEILNNQTVLDALNNPFCLSKEGIPSATFLLDLNLYQDVLIRGKKYAIRVKADAMNPNPLFVFENNGYSRVEAFQFGSETTTTSNPAWNVQHYFIPLHDRKSNFWDDYETRRGRDTLVPIEEYIAYKLMQQGVAYNLDAIELLLSLNPELKDQKQVKLYQPLNLPVLPEVPSKLEKEFETAHANNIKPGNEELALFRKYLDSLKKTSKVPEIFVNEFSQLRSHLDQFSSQASQLNRVSLDLVNVMLSELLFNLRKFAGNMTNGEHNHLRSLASDLKAISVIPSSSSFFSIDSSGKDLASGFSKSFLPGIYGILSSYPYYAKEAIKDKAQRDFYAITDQLIPLNIVVYRPVSPPAKPIFDAPDLKGVFRIFYTTKNLYNNRNPEINAKSPGPLASTTQVSLPGRIDYKFWSLNMLTHKSTLPQDIDINELFSSNQKKDLKGKKLTVILKVE